MAPPPKTTEAPQKRLLGKPVKVKPTATTLKLKKLLSAKPERKRNPPTKARPPPPRVSIEPAAARSAISIERPKPKHSNIFGTVKNANVLQALQPKKRQRLETTDGPCKKQRKLLARPSNSKKPSKSATKGESTSSLSMKKDGTNSVNQPKNISTVESCNASEKSDTVLSCQKRHHAGDSTLSGVSTVAPSLPLLPSRREKNRIARRQQPLLMHDAACLPSPTKKVPVVSESGGEDTQQQVKEATIDNNLAPVEMKPVVRPIAAAQYIPKSMPDMNADSKPKSKPKANYVRLNLRNKAGACRGARNKAKLSKSKQRREERRKEFKQNMAVKRSECALFGSDSQAMTNTKNGVDLVDDYIDGVFTTAIKKSKGKTIPRCSAHQAPCKLLTVKKAGPNKGRPFYVCSLPRDEQCNYFQWADDTVQAAQAALLSNKSVSGFIARQTASYMDQIKCLTVPELKDLAKRHKLKATGKKSELTTRLTIWVRDEIASGVKEDGTVPEEQEKPDAVNAAIEADEQLEASSSDSDGDSTASQSEDELEFVGKRPAKQVGVASSDANGSSDDDSRCNEQGDTVPGLPATSPRAMLRKLFGYSGFRDGQEWAVQRCLDHQRSLLVAPTGFGKSLCFALPAAIMDGICIVVSPLLSLIQDQIRMLPARLPAVTLSGPLSNAKMAATLDDIVRGRIKILFVSPERLASASFRRLFCQKWNNTTQSYARMFPEVSLLCVDEAHCLSQWAHNFRPCYLRLRSIVSELIRPRSVLAITATAGPRVAEDICRTLEIPCDGTTDGSAGVRISQTNRDNIDVKCLFLESQEDRLSKLIAILSKPNEKKRARGCDLTGCLSKGSVIVYVWRQRDAEVVAENIQAGGIPGGVVCYHGGMDSATRAKVQSQFMRGKARICVATIAFGLGINKADVAGVVHMYCPSSPEHYIQEIGRAGRNGMPARAIALILKDEVLIRHSLAHSDLISRSQIATLLSFMKIQVVRSVQLLPDGRDEDQPIYVALPLAAAVLGCDCKGETTETIASLLEQRDEGEPLLSIEGITYDSVTVAPKRKRLEQLAESEPIAKALLHCGQCVESPAGADSSTKSDSEVAPRKAKLVGDIFGSYSASVAHCANFLGDSAEPRHVFAALRRLEGTGEIDMVLDTEPRARVLGLRLSKLGKEYFQETCGNRIGTLIDQLQEKFQSTISSNCCKAIDMHYIMRQVSQVEDAPDKDADSEKSASLIKFQSLTSQYFEAEGQGQSLSTAAAATEFDTEINSVQLTRDAQQVVAYLQELQAASESSPMIRIGDVSTVDYTALIVTKFLHGLAPAFVTLSAIRNHHLLGKMQRFEFSAVYKALMGLLQSRRGSQCSS